MIRRIAGVGLFLAVAITCWGQSTTTDKAQKDAAKDDRRFLPRHWVRGYVDFDATPGHHEIDLGLCLPPGCSDYARYEWSAYVEAQPIARGPLKSLFFFAHPKLYGGNNEPGTNYTMSAAPILWEREAGVGWELSRGLQIRISEHKNFLLGRFARPAPGGPPLIPNGPYGANVRVGVRWNFGGWGSTSE